MSLKKAAQTTLDILEKGAYLNPKGQLIRLADDIAFAVSHTVLHAPTQAEEILRKQVSVRRCATSVEVTSETTQAAARRMATLAPNPVLLNFASARNPGGGFLNGAKAQEEDLARCSGLYPCLLTQCSYYEANRETESMLYTDHLIYSPKVPWFQVRQGEPLDEPFLASVITAPAPNAGQALARDPAAGPAIAKTLHRRAGMVLAVAREHGHRHLVLGAWGCGVFRNDPTEVAETFGRWLEDPAFQGCFDHVVFAIHDRSAEQATLKAFQQRFNGGVRPLTSH